MTSMLYMIGPTGIGVARLKSVIYPLIFAMTVIMSSPILFDSNFEVYGITTYSVLIPTAAAGTVNSA